MANSAPPRGGDPTTQTNAVERPATTPGIEPVEWELQTFVDASRFAEVRPGERVNVQWLIDKKYLAPLPVHWP